MSAYSIMTCERVFPSTAISQAPFFATGPWFSGHPLGFAVPAPLRYTLDPDYPGQLKAFYREAAPIMRHDLLDTLRTAGVDNLERFDALLVDPTTGAEHRDYSAVNVLGVVRSADLSMSVRVEGSVDALVTMGFESVVLDDRRPDGLLLFRLAESVGAIVVHERVRRAVESAGIPGMTFYDEGEWSTP